MNHESESRSLRQRVVRRPGFSFVLPLGLAAMLAWSVSLAQTTQPATGHATPVGKITTVNKDMVSFNLGGRQGIRIDDSLGIYRSDQKVATVTVRVVGADDGAGIVDDKKFTAVVGDIVTKGGPPPTSGQASPSTRTASVPATSKAEVYSDWPFDAKEAQRRQDETAKALGVPKLATVDLGNKLSMKFVLIPAGKFMMGSPDTQKYHQLNEGPQHEVTITRPYYVAIYIVTQEQFQQVVGRNPSQHQGKTWPADTVSFSDASEFCKKLSEKSGKKIHLLTEAQWEFACRAGTTTIWYFGDDESKIGEYMWYRENVGGTMHPPGQKKPNAFGLYDMHGLMWEWCSDNYAEDAYAEQVDKKAIDPQGPATGKGHSVRGGTWGSRPPAVRTAVRNSALDPVNDRYGMRVMMEVEER